MSDSIYQIAEALHRDDAPGVRDLLERHPELKSRVNEPIGPFDSPAILHVRSKAMLDVWLDAGADINARSRWWAGGFGLLDQADPELAAYAVERGAVVDAHAASRLGWSERLQTLVAEHPELVHARGGDGQTPLHFASSIEIAEWLLDHGADIDARDLDHESTPAQHMVRDRGLIARYLAERGCTTDILMAAALGDTARIRAHLDAEPDCIRWRVSDEYFPMIHAQSGGTIYQWTLGWYVSPHEVALQFGHDDAYRLLIERSPQDVRWVVACWLGDEATVEAIVARDPDLVSRLSTSDQRQLAHAARNDNLAAVRSMLVAGLPVDARGQHGATALHWAAFHGNFEMASAILAHDPPLEVKDDDFHRTPLGWALYGSDQGWHKDRGNYPATIDVLRRRGQSPFQQTGD